MMVAFHFVLVFTLFIEIYCDSDCQHKFKNVRLTPKYFDCGTSSDLKIVFGDKSKVQCGNRVTSLLPLNPPVVTYNAKKNCKYMSIVFFDPDVPLPPHIYLQWFVVNVPAKVMRKGYKGQAGKALAPFLPPLSPTNYNRYTFCVYYQNEYINTCKKYDLLSRSGVYPRDLAKQYNLQSAEACNFFYLTGVSFPPLLHNQPAVEDVNSVYKDLFNQDKTRLL